ncbi:MAG TPA: GAF domain-containing protein [Streptosporangiaceae bacterium]
MTSEPPPSSHHGAFLPHLRLDDLLGELQNRLEAVLATRDRTHALLEAVVTIGSGLELDALLRRLVESAVNLVDARYGALGIIGDGVRLAQFIPVGVTQEEILRIEHWPEGHGLLGLLIKQPQVLRLADIASHPESYGFPPGHPRMSAFLGAPIRVGDEVFGNIYLTEKRGGGPFDEEDEAITTALAAAAGVAIDNARLYEQVRRREQYLAASERITRTLLSGTDPDEVLGYIAHLAREITGVSLGMIALPDPDGRHLYVRIADGWDAEALQGERVVIEGTLAGDAFRNGLPTTTEDATLRKDAAPLTGVRDFGPVLCVPLGTTESVRGVLEVAGRRGMTPFSGEIKRMLHAYAGQASVALELAEHRRDAERLVLLEDRDRIAKDLHDRVIQRLFATGMTLTGAARIARPEVASRLHEAVDDVDGTIQQIRTAIFGLQPVEQSNVSLQARMMNVVVDAAAPLGFTPSMSFSGLIDSGVTEDVGENAIAVLQESLSNATRHAHARNVWVTVSVDDDPSGALTVLVEDDGVGPGDATRRSGLRNLEERATGLDGTFTVSARGGGGMSVRWRVPLEADEPAADQ